MEEKKQRQIDILKNKYGRQYDSIVSMKQFLVEYEKELPKDMFTRYIKDFEELRNGFAFLVNEYYSSIFSEDLLPGYDPKEVVNPEIYSQEAVEELDQCKDDLTKRGLDRVLYSWKPYHYYGRELNNMDVNDTLESKDLGKVQKFLSKVSSTSKIALFDDAITITPLLKKIEQKEKELNDSHPFSLKLTNS